MSDSTLTLEKLREAMASIPPLAPQARDLFGYRPFTFAGMDVYERPPEPPKLRVSDSCPMTDEARAEMNAWLLERFGRQDKLPAVLWVNGMGLFVRHGAWPLLGAIA